MDVSIVIVNYKTPVLLKDCIKSIIEYSHGFEFEIIVVDNHSEDESKYLITSNFPTVKWIDVGWNAGFGSANNKGIKIAKGDYVLLLNSDTELYENSILKTLKFYIEQSQTKKVGFLGCKIEHRDKKLQPSCNYYWSGIKEAIQAHPVWIKIFQLWLGRKKLRDINKYEKLNKNHQLTWLGVPFALIKSEILKKTMFDEHFFMYSEDEELNCRLTKAGYNPYFFAGTGVFHIIGASSKNNLKKAKQIFCSKLLFILKSRGELYFNIYCLVLKSGLKFDIYLNKSGISPAKNELNWLVNEKNNIKKILKSKSQLNFLC